MGRCFRRDPETTFLPERTDAAAAARTAVLVLAFCFVANMLVRGVLEAYAVFLLPISASFDWSRAEVSGVYSLAFLVIGFSGPVVGILFDRWGPLRLYLCGMVAAGIACLLASQVQSLWQLHLVLGICLGVAGACVGVVPMAAFLRRWFRARLNTALAVGHTSQGVAILLLVPSSQYLIEGVGWRTAYAVLAVVVIVAILAMAMLVPWRKVERGAAVAGSLSSAAGAAPLPEHGPGVRDALRMPAFWGIIASYLFTGIGMFTVSLQGPAYLISVGYSPTLAAEAFGLIGFLVPVGMISFGWLGDRIGRRNVVLISYTGTLIGIAGLHFLRDGPSLPALAVFVIGFGLTFGSRGPAISAIAASLFGGRNFGRIYGIVSIGMGGGSAIGAWFGGYMLDITGDYVVGQSLAMLAVLFGALPFVAVRAISRS